MLKWIMKIKQNRKQQRQRRREQQQQQRKIFKIVMATQLDKGQ